MGTALMTEQTAARSQIAYARLAGLMYLVVLGFDIAGAAIAASVVGSGGFVATSHRIATSETLYRVGLCCGLVASLSTILLTIGLDVAVKLANGNLALMTLVFSICEAAIAGMLAILGSTALQLHLAATPANGITANQLGALADLNSRVGTDVGAKGFSLGPTIFIYVFLQSRYVPRMLSTWDIFASLVYATVWFKSLILPPAAATAAAFGSVPILIAELSTGLWLLIRGIDLQAMK